MTWKKIRTIIVPAAPLATALTLALLTTWVWYMQVDYQRRLQSRHTSDVCYQASRRIQVLVDYALRAVRVHANNWSMLERSEQSSQRFLRLSASLLQHLPGFLSVQLVQPAGGEVWSAPSGPSSSPALDAVARRELIVKADTRGDVALSAPIMSRDGVTVLYVAFPLGARQKNVGHLVLELHPERLIGGGFHQNIRAEFQLKLEDGETSLFRFPAPLDDRLGGDQKGSARRQFSVADRTWNLTIAPRGGQLASSGWLTHLSIPILGFFLAACMGLAVHLLSRRMVLYRAARDQALQEVAQRERAQSALHESESRYHGVFDSATDGLLVLDGAGKILEANRTACLMCGREVGSLAGLSLKDLFGPGDNQALGDFIRQARSVGSSDLELAIDRTDGSTVEIKLQGTTLHHAGEKRVLAILSDVSEMKQAVRRQALLSRKIMMAQEEERSRISRDLHDELGQILTALHLELDWLQESMTSTTPAPAGAFEDAAGMVESAASELRRICQGLRPPLLDDLGLEPAVRQLIEEEEERMGVAADLRISLGDAAVPVSPDVALCVYRVVQESLHNIRRHAQARNMKISLVSSESRLSLVVHDDGVGFDMSRDEKPQAGFGIAGMRERALLVNGTLDVRTEPHQGTRIVLEVPLGAEEEGGA